MSAMADILQINDDDNPVSINQDLHLVYFAAGCVSIVVSLFVVISYWLYPVMRRHPAKLIFWRTMFDMAFALTFAVLFFVPNERVAESCDWLGPLFHFFLLGSQTWYFMMTVDLLTALRNPFTDLQSNVKYYHAAVWGTNLLAIVIISSSDQFAYRPGLQLCWIKKQSDDIFSANIYSWIFFFIPTICYTIFSVIVATAASIRFRKGLLETQKVRTQVLHDGISYNVAFSLYWVIAGSLYASVYNRDIGSEDEEGTALLFGSFATTIGLLGVVDAIVWFVNNREYYRRRFNGEDIRIIKPNRPINEALRREVLYYTTAGMIRGLSMASKTPELASMPPPVEHSQYFATTTTPPAANFAHAYAIVKLEHVGNMDEINRRASELSVQRGESKASVLLRARLSSHDGAEAPPLNFVDYSPQIFRLLRARFGVAHDAYLDSLGGDFGSMLAKYSQGRSNAFFFYTSDSRYIVKTLIKSEMLKLIRILPRYVKYIVKTLIKSEMLKLIRILPRYVKYVLDNPEALINRVVGMHSLRVYHQTMYFVVMENIFLSPLTIHETYDLKGSWVDRKSKDRRALGVMGFNSGIMKDSDLHKRLLMRPTTRRTFLAQVKKDSRFLASLNIMDYSLLVGVHYIRQGRPATTKDMYMSSQAMPRIIRPVANSIRPSTSSGGYFGVGYEPGHRRSDPVRSTNNPYDALEEKSRYNSTDALGAEQHGLATVHMSRTALKLREAEREAAAAGAYGGAPIPVSRRSAPARSGAVSHHGPVAVAVEATVTESAGDTDGANYQLSVVVEGGANASDRQVMRPGAAVGADAALPTTRSARSMSHSLTQSRGALEMERVEADGEAGGANSDSSSQRRLANQRGDKSASAADNDVDAKANASSQRRSNDLKQPFLSSATGDGPDHEEEPSVVERPPTKSNIAGIEAASKRKKKKHRSPGSRSHRRHRSAAAGTYHHRNDRKSGTEAASKRKKKKHRSPSPNSRSHRRHRSAAPGTGTARHHHHNHLQYPSPESSDDFLSPFRSMDESEHAPLRDSVFHAFEGGIRAEVIEGPGIYFVGIIDILQEWNWKKKLERFFKTYVRRKDPHGVSCVAPFPYQRRFMRSMHEITEEIQLADDVLELSVDYKRTRNGGSFTKDTEPEQAQQGEAEAGAPE